MKHATEYPLYFETCNGMVAAPLSRSVFRALRNMRYCLPWSSGGKRGLAFCDPFVYEELEQQLLADLKDAALAKRIIHSVAYRNEPDSPDRFSIPWLAARYAGIDGKAVLIRLSEHALLLQAEPAAEPQEGGSAPV